MEYPLFDDLKIGLIEQVFTVERNLLIWGSVADEKSFLEQQSKEVQKLFSFIQVSAQTNFVLALGKLYDIPNKYPTHSILYFLNLVEKEIESLDVIVEKTAVRQLLEFYRVSNELINALDDPDPKSFPIKFVAYYREIYRSESVTSDINSLKSVRDKIVAHNEATTETMYYLDFDVINRLLKLPTEIISVFGKAYHSTIWESNGFSMIKRSAEHDSFFVKAVIDILKGDERG